MITMLLRSTRKQSRIFIPLLVIKVVVGDQLEQLGVLHSTKRVVMVAAPLLMMMMRLRITELSIGTERAPTESDVDSLDDEEEIEEEEAPPVQHPPQGGQPPHSIHFGMLEVHSTKVPNYVARVNYKAKGMTKRAREQRRIDPRS